MSELRRRTAAVRRAILRHVGINLIAGLLGITPPLVSVLSGVDELRIVGPLLLVPVLSTT